MEKRILVVEDDVVMRRFLTGGLEASGYTVEEATNGVEAIKVIGRREPDLIICDHFMPQMDGLALVEHLKRDVFHQQIPFIMLTANETVNAIVNGLEAGADDYLIKPIEIEELRLRVLVQLRRRNRDLLTNPFTRLPSGDRVQQQLRAQIATGKAFVVLYADLDNFKPVVDRYGFVRAGEIIKATAKLFYRSVVQKGGADSFVGHIAGDDFIAICPPKSAAPLARDFIARFDRMAPDFYDPVDRQEGHFKGVDRDGKERTFPLLSVSLCGVDSRTLDPLSVESIAARASTARPRAKGIEGSCYIAA